MFCSFINILSLVEEVPCTLVCQVGKSITLFFLGLHLCVFLVYYQHGKNMRLKQHYAYYFF